MLKEMISMPKCSVEIGGIIVLKPKLKKNRNGSALVFVLIVLLVMSILGASVLSLSVSENRQAVLQESAMRGYYSARAGADAMASHLISNPNELDNLIEKSKVGPTTGSIDGRDFEVYVTGTEHEFIIESISYNPDGLEASRTYLTMKEVNLLDHAIFADEIINVGNNALINGNIGTNSNHINFGHNKINGNITIGAGSTTEDIETAKTGMVDGFVVNELASPLIIPIPDPDKFPVVIHDGTTNINTNDYSDELDDGRLYAIINNINISGNSEFIAQGGGQVHLFVEGSITASGNSTIRTDGDTELFLYSDTNGTITFNGGPTQSNITIYAPNSTIAFNGGGSNPNVKGSFISKKFSGPSSNVIITQGTGSMEDLNLSEVAGYYRAVWSN